MTYSNDANPRTQPTTSTSSSSTITTSTTSSTFSAYFNSASTYSASSPTISPAASASQIALSRPSSSSKTGNLSVGTVAGVAVAAAIGGALLAFILSFILMRRRSRKSGRTDQPSEKRHTFNGAKALLTRSSDDDLLERKRAWEKRLPQPADDNSIRLAIKTLLHQIELHVENFYTDSAALGDVSDQVQAELHKLDSPFFPKPLAVLLPQARLKTALMKHCLARLIVSKITTDCTPTGTGTFDTNQSFLPQEFTSLPQAIERAHSGPNKPAFSQSLSRWRVLTSYLYPAPHTSSVDTTCTTARDATISAAASTFCTAFSPWATSTRPTHQNPKRNTADTARFQNLVTIMQSAADVGIMLFAQPAAFSWTWDVGAGGKNVRGSNGGGGGGRTSEMIVLTPGLVKVTDDDAVVLERPQVMVQQVVHEF